MSLEAGIVFTYSGQDLVGRGLRVTGQRGEAREDVELVGAEVGTLSVGLLHGLRMPSALPSRAWTAWYAPLESQKASSAGASRAGGGGSS